MATPGRCENDERRFAFRVLCRCRRRGCSMNEATGDAGTCYGDSGGPHFLGGETSNLIVSITLTGDADVKRRTGPIGSTRRRPGAS
jgi:hypothetical protein